MLTVQRNAQLRGMETISIVGRRKVVKDVPCVKFGNLFSFWIHVALTTVLDRHGSGSIYYTKRIIKLLKAEKPDIIHLHNIHGYFINYPILFNFLSEDFYGKVVWTFHDCWPFTGHCPHFVAKNCFKWKTECNACPNKKEYPISLFVDGSRANYRNKKYYFGKVKNLVITTPSQWMADWIKQSYLGEYRIRVINNGIDLDIFKYKPQKQVIEKYCLPDKKIVLGVASVWEPRKGLNDMISIAEEVGNDCIVVVVGVHKNQIKLLPANMYGIERTENVNDLVALYSAASVFVNPSKEESFSLVTVEAMACGTPVIVLGLSAVKELVTQKCGIVLKENSVNNYIAAINTVFDSNYDREDVRSEVLKYSNQNMVDQYIKLYEELCPNE